MNQPLSYVHPAAKIAKTVVIEPFTTIGKDVIIGEGFHEEFGKAHAEVNAINRVEDKEKLKKGEETKLT